MKVSRAAVIASLATSIVACSASERSPSKSNAANGGTGDPSQINVGDSGTTTTPAECIQNVDIVFVMDVSSSMDAFLNKLAQDMVGVDTRVRALSPNASPYYGLTVFVDNTKVLNAGNPFQNTDSLKKEFEKWASFTVYNKQIDATASNTTWPENSIDALHDAATAFKWRPGSLRIIIHTTDDTFWDGPLQEDGMTIRHGYAEAVAKLDENEIRVFSFAAHKGGADEDLDVSAGWFGPYKGQPAIPVATQGAAFPIEDVLSGKVSLATSIEGVVKDTLCKPYHVR